MQFPNFYTFWVIEDSSITNLTFEGSLAGTLLVLFISSSGTLIGMRMNDQLTDNFVHYQELWQNLDS